MEFANMAYYCYQFYYSVDFTTRKRLSLFSDLYDFYSSFLFNLMSRSVSIKNIGLKIYNLTTNETIMGRGPIMAGEWSKIIRLILDFQSQNKASLDGKPSLDETKQKRLIQPPKPGDRMLIDHVAYYLLTGRPLVKEPQKMRSPWLNVTFSLGDFFNVPLGFIEGGMMAIKSKVTNEFCAKSSKSAR